MAWIESHDTLPDHPKLKRLADTLGQGLPETFWNLHNLWYWSLRYAESGDLSGFTASEIAAAARFSGDCKKLRSALSACGWLNRDGTIHDWQEFAGYLLNARARLRRHREMKRFKDVPETLQQRCGNVTVTATVPNPTVTQPNPTEPDQTKGAASFSPPVPSGDNGAGPGPDRSSSPAALLADLYLRINGPIIRRDKAVAHVDAAISVGVPAARLEEEISRPDRKGWQIWEIIADLRPVVIKSPEQRRAEEERAEMKKLHEIVVAQETAQEKEKLEEKKLWEEKQRLIREKKKLEGSKC